MVDEPAVTLCRVPFAFAKIGTVMTARSYVPRRPRQVARRADERVWTDWLRDDFGLHSLCARSSEDGAVSNVWRITMKALTLALVTSAGIGLFAVSASSAAPVSGADIGTAASADQLKQNVQYWRWRDHWRHHWGWHRGWCYYHPYRC
jgi:hypothetical protein